MLDRVYPAVTRMIWFMLSCALLLSILGGFIVVYGEAPPVGLIITGVAFTVLVAILIGTSLLAIGNRRALRKKVIAVYRSVLFVDETSYQDNELLRLTIQEEVIPALNTLATRINRAIAKHNFPESYLISDRIFDLLVICRVGRWGSVILEWGSMKKVVHGFANGSSVEVEWRPAEPGIFVSLVQHELGHVLLYQGSSRNNTVVQHLILNTIGI